VAFRMTKTRGAGPAASIPGCEPGEQTTGSAQTFDQARADFEQAWVVFLSNRTEADFQKWRDARDWTAKKYAMWERGEKLPSQKPSSLMRCPCGEVFDSHRLENTVIHVPHITAAGLVRRADPAPTDPRRGTNRPDSGLNATILGVALCPGNDRSINLSPCRVDRRRERSAMPPITLNNSPNQSVTRRNGGLPFRC
jgi:hypothetical protein